MSRKKNVDLIRKLSPDPKFNSVTVERLCNKIMYDGKKSVAQKLVWSALDIVSKTIGSDPVSVLDTAIENISPVSTLKRARVGGANHQVPVPASQRKASNTAFTFLINASRKRNDRVAVNRANTSSSDNAEHFKGLQFALRLAREIIDAFQKKGAAFKSFEDHRKMVEANRAFARS